MNQGADDLGLRGGACQAWPQGTSPDGAQGTRCLHHMMSHICGLRCVHGQNTAYMPVGRDAGKGRRLNAQRRKVALSE